MQGNSLAVLALLALATFAAPSCATVRDAQRIDEMGDAELARFSKSAAIKVDALVDASIYEGWLSESDPLRMADAIDAILGDASAAVYASDLIKGFIPPEKRGGPGEAVLAIALSDLDSWLSERGMFDGDGLLTNRGRAVLREIGVHLRDRPALNSS